VAYKEQCFSTAGPRPSKGPSSSRKKNLPGRGLTKVENHWLRVPREKYKLYRVSQEGRSIFWEVIILVILSKNLYMHMCHIPNVFRDRDISLYSSKLLIRKKYYALFLIPVFIVQETKLVHVRFEVSTAVTMMIIISQKMIIIKVGTVYLV
jgi:hypothetical protein